MSVKHQFSQRLFFFFLLSQALAKASGCSPAGSGVPPHRCASRGARTRTPRAPLGTGGGQRGVPSASPPGGDPRSDLAREAKSPAPVSSRIRKSAPASPGCPAGPGVGHPREPPEGAAPCAAASAGRLPATGGFFGFHSILQFAQVRSWVEAPAPGGTRSPRGAGQEVPEQPRPAPVQRRRDVRRAEKEREKSADVLKRDGFFFNKGWKLKEEKNLKFKNTQRVSKIVTSERNPNKERRKMKEGKKKKPNKPKLKFILNLIPKEKTKSLSGEFKFAFYACRSHLFS